MNLEIESGRITGDKPKPFSYAKGAIDVISMATPLIASVILSLSLLRSGGEISFNFFAVLVFSLSHVVFLFFAVTCLQKNKSLDRINKIAEIQLKARNFNIFHALLTLALIILSFCINNNYFELGTGLSIGIFFYFSLVILSYSKIINYLNPKLDPLSAKLILSQNPQIDGVVDPLETPVRIINRAIRDESYLSEIRRKNTVNEDASYSVNDERFWDSI